MKLYFRKNQWDIYPRISFIWSGINKLPSPKPFSKITSNIIMISLLSVVLALTVIWAIFFDISSQKLIISSIATFIIGLPIHELLHAIYVWMIGGKVEGIYFFPKNKRVPLLKRPGAYVYPDFIVVNKFNTIMISAFPLIILTSVPLIFAVFLPSISDILFFIAIWGFAMASLDICNIIQLILRMPNDSLYFFNVVYFTPTDAPAVFKMITKRNDRDELIYREFIFDKGNFSEVEFEHDERTLKLEKEFTVQFELRTES